MKGIANIVIVAVVAVAALSLFAASSAGIFTVAPLPCDDFPFQQNCYCPEGYQRLSLTWLGGINKNVCEEVRITDPDEDAVFMAKAALSELFPDCDTIACGQSMIEGATTTTQVSFGETIPGTIDARIECKTYHSDQPLQDVWWSVHVDRETGEVLIPFSVLAPFCTSLDGTIYR